MARIRVGDVFRVVGSRVQPVSLPLDDDAAHLELDRLEELRIAADDAFRSGRDLLDEASVFRERNELERRGGAKGGRKKLGKRKRPDLNAARLGAELEDLLAQGETRTNARKRLAKKYGLSLSTIRRRTPAK